MAQVRAEQEQPTTKGLTYCCPNCNYSMYIYRFKRHGIDNINSTQLWSCNNCGFKWKEMWSSYSQSIWSSRP
jgi:DNA-directed RNA polymerase subunit M/transcription elongation factor TFIIS